MGFCFPTDAPAPMRRAALPLLLTVFAAPALAQAIDWRIDQQVDDRLTLRASLPAETCPDWAQGLGQFGDARVTADRMVGSKRLVRVAYDSAGVEAECLGGLALLSGPTDRLQPFLQ